MLIQEYCFFD